MTAALCVVQAKVNVVQSIQRFLNKYGFRCINELKLEEKTLHDDPSFVLNTIAGQPAAVESNYKVPLQPQYWVANTNYSGLGSGHTCLSPTSFHPSWFMGIDNYSVSFNLSSDSCFFRYCNRLCAHQALLNLKHGGERERDQSQG